MATRSKNKIIIIEDDEDLLKLLTFSFEAKDFDLQTFTTGKEASAFLSDEQNLHNVCLIILDRILPDMDGLEILKELTRRLQDKIPVLILSFLASEKDILSGLKEGATDYISKPFSMSILIEKALSLVDK